MGAELQRQPVAKLVKDDRKRLPRELPIGTEPVHDLVEPDIGRLERLVEDFESGGAHRRSSFHANPRSIANDRGSSLFRPCWRAVVAPGREAELRLRNIGESRRFYG